MNKILLDCGSHLGESVNKFRRIQPDISEFSIYMFEPNPSLFKSIEDNDSFNECIKFNSAICGEDGIQRFWGCIDNPESVGATLEKSKANFDKIKEMDYIDTKTIDLSRFIIEKFEPTDYIILKLDIEGSEYEVLEKLISTGTIKYINKLYCEFHSQWLSPEFKERETKLIKNLISNKIRPQYWDAL